MVNDCDLKKVIYWAEVTDGGCKELYGKQLKVKFTGILFREVDDAKPVGQKQTFYLSQLKIFREARNEE